jgi:hypothetical protein
MKKAASLAITAIIILFALSCGGENTDNSENSGTTDNSGGNASMNNGPSGGVSGPSASGPSQSEMQVELANEQMRQGNFDEAIAILETMAETTPDFPGLNEKLIEAHLGYTNKIAGERMVPPNLLNETLYNHYMRVLELDPENAEAEAGVSASMVFFESRGMTPPEKVDPLAFLPAPQEGIKLEER